MDESKRFYWIKLKTDFFDMPTIDWLMDQKNGCEYVVLYQKLCLLAANTGGSLIRKIGQMIIPYDVKKIAEITKFKFDTVVVALDLYKKIGLIYECNEGIMAISNFENVVGSETKWAEKKRLQRGQAKDNSEDNVPKLSKDNVRQEIEYRDKSIETRDKELDIEPPKSPKSKKQFDTPTAKKQYAEFVTMTNDEYKSLVDNERLGSETAVNRCIEILDDYKGANGKKYKSDYRAIKTWVIDRYIEEQSKGIRKISRPAETGNKQIDEIQKAMEMLKNE